MDILFNKSKFDCQLLEQRGVPLGPLLFSLAIWHIFIGMKSKLPIISQRFWYHGEGMIAGFEIEQGKTIKILTMSGANCS